MHISYLTNAEEHLMQLLWELGEFYMKEVVERHPEPKPHHNTISTYLKILAEKQFISAHKEGRICKYRVEVPREEYKKFVIRNFVAGYQISSEELLRLLLDEQLLKPDDISKLFEAQAVVTPKYTYPGKESMLSGKKAKKKKKKK